MITLITAKLFVVTSKLFTSFQTNINGVVQDLMSAPASLFVWLENKPPLIAQRKLSVTCSCWSLKGSRNWRW